MLDGKLGPKFREVLSGPDFDADGSLHLIGVQEGQVTRIRVAP